MDTKICNSSKKRARRRSHTRKFPLDGIINMAEARREIVNALQLHRSTTSTGNESSSMNKKSTVIVPVESSQERRYYYPLMHESIEPTWSTTAPAVFAVPPVVGEMVEFEWPENASASYSWWSSFLNSLDGKNNVLVESSNMVYGNEYQCGQNIGENLGFEDQNPFPDEWLVAPTTTEDPYTEGQGSNS